MKIMNNTVKRKPFGSWKTWALLLAVAVSSTLTGCLNDDTQPFPPAAFVSFYHGSPDAPALDVNVDGKIITSNPFHFSEVLPYNRFFTGKRNFKFSPANAVNNLLDKDITFEIDKVYSVFLAGEMSNLQALVLEDDWEDPDADHASIRFIHLSPDAGVVGLSVSGEEDSFTEPATFLTTSVFEKLDKGKYTLSVKSKVNGELMVSAADVEIKGNRVYTIVLRGKKSLSDGDKKLNLQLITNYIQF